MVVVPKLSFQTGWWLRKGPALASWQIFHYAPGKRKRIGLRDTWRVWGENGGVCYQALGCGSGRGLEVPQNAPACLLPQGQLLLAGFIVTTSSADLCVLGSNGNAFLKNAR